MLAITTSSGFIVPTWEKEKAQKQENYGRIFSDSLIPRTENCEKFLDTNYSFKLMPGIKDQKEIKGVYAGIKASRYRVYSGNHMRNYKEYDMEGYYIPCKITKDRKIYPIFRNATYDEKWIFFKKDDYIESKPIAKDKLAEVVEPFLNKEWPILIEI